MQDDPGSSGDVAALPFANRLYDQSLRLVNIGAWECDLRTERLTWSDGVYRLFDIEPGSPLTRAPILDMYFEESRRQLETVRADAIRHQHPFALDVRVRTRSQTSRWIRITGDVAVEAGRPVRLFGVKQEVTREREEWARLRHMAERDPLTGLANRGLFDRHYRQMVDDDPAHAFASALVLVDLDRFKQVNDRFGHAAGDACLRQVAVRLQRTFPDAALIARLGGDEFAVLLRTPLGPTRLGQMLKRASRTLCRPHVWNGIEMDVGASIGAAFLPQPAGPPGADLFDRADAALYRAKAAGPNATSVDGDDPFTA